MKIKAKMITSLVIRVTAILLSFYLQVWIVRKFGANTYGEYISFITIASLLVILSKGGIDTIVMKQTAIAWSKFDIFSIRIIRVQSLKLSIVMALLIVASYIVFNSLQPS